MAATAGPMACMTVGGRLEGGNLEALAACALPALWPHLSRRARQSLRLCCKSLRDVADVLVVSLALSNMPGCEPRAAARRWPNLHALALRLSCCCKDGALLAPVNAGLFPKLRTLNVHLVRFAALPAAWETWRYKRHCHMLLLLSHA